MRDINTAEMMDVIGSGPTCYGILLRVGDISACIGYLDV